LATSPIQNWVILTPGTEVRLRFSDHRIVTKLITDPLTKAGREAFRPGVSGFCRASGGGLRPEGGK